MSSYDKIKARIMQDKTPTDINPDELKSFLEQYGFVLCHVNGSHFIYSLPRSDRNYMVNIPMHKPVKPWYIKELKKIISSIEED